MTRDHKSIIDRARRDGLHPMEMAEELMGHDLLEICLTQMKSHAVAYKNMSEIQQDSAIAQMQEAMKDAIKTAVSIIGAQATKTVRLSLKGCVVSKKLKITGEVSASEEWKHELLDAATDQADVLVILNERDFLQGMDAHHGDKQQKSLDIDSAEMTSKVTKAKVIKEPLKAVPKASVTPITDVKPELIDKARAYVIESRNPTTPGIQNLLSKGFSTAEAVLAILAEEDVIVAAEDGTYTMPSLTSTDVAPEEVIPDAEPVKKLTKAQQKKLDAEAAPVADEPAAEDSNTGWGATLTDDLYAAIKAKVIKDQKVSSGAIAVAFDIGINVADEAIDRLEMMSVISEEDELGGRLVFDAE